MSSFSLDDLDTIIAARVQSTDAASYTATLISCGIEKCAQKLGEEAVETAIAAACGDMDGVRRESADLLYHLLVLLKVSGVPLQDVMQELESRTAQSGHAEKAGRKKS